MAGCKAKPQLPDAGNRKSAIENQQSKMGDRTYRRLGIGELVLTGGVLGLLLAVMKLMELSYLTRDMTFEAYLAGIALLFLVAGGMIGRRFFPGRTAEAGVQGGTAPAAAEGDTDENEALPGPSVRSAPWGELSDREFEILELVAQGKTNREIAAKLFLSPNTIKSHVSNIYRKLDVARRPEAVARAKELAILQ